MNAAAAIERMRALLGPQGRVDDADRQAAYLIDHRGLYQGRAALIARPASTAEVAELIRLAAEARIAIVPQGGNTGYCGGATPDDSGNAVLLSLERMRRIRALDEADFTITVEAGVVLAEVQRAAEAAGLYFPLSLGAEGSCRIGGNLATNAGGVNVLRYGNARSLVLGLEVVLPDGRVWNGLRSLRKDNSGYDLKQLFIGAEGTLGVITAAVLTLFPGPQQRQSALLAVRDPAAAVELVATARRTSGDMVSSFEYLPRFALELVLEHIEGARDPFDRAYPHYALIELASAASRVSLESLLEGLLEDGLESGRVLDAVIAQSGAQRDALWHIREHVPEAQKKAGGSLKHDVSVPISRIAELLARASAEIEAACPGVRICAYGHLGDGNLHFNLQAPAGESLQRFVANHGARLSAIVHDHTLALGGSLCAEHGVGQLKRELLAGSADPVALELMRSLKRALDPNGLMNPGKVL